MGKDHIDIGDGDKARGKTRHRLEASEPEDQITDGENDLEMDGCWEIFH